MSKIEECVKKLEVGTPFVECYGFHVARFVCKTKPVRSEDGAWEWTGTYVHDEEREGQECEFLIREGYEHYGPKVYLD
ncbi:hypothetical protein CL89_gp071 [Aeromonas phage PX29]|uniref:Uncharacterized protein n=1 Tax=Aeromonas phage PX29 TaxID=926067 RepID=E5DQ04_9CAUD|nr:hypothetical protein CL89_gp071 [Aeromonas phage PX29]ADQ52790.1 conserved hypothetical protein [Aeromonas phage PX29]